MAFKTWQIGLHIQQHEALAIAVIRGASGWSCNVGGDCR